MTKQLTGWVLKFLLIILCNLFLSIGFAANNTEPLPSEQAFHFRVSINQDYKLELNWQIADGYYLYGDQIKIKPGPDNQVSLGSFTLPHGKEKQDAIRGSYEVFKNSIQFLIPLKEKNQQLDLNIRYQGCSEAGFCYAPINQTLKVDLAKVRPPLDLSLYLTTAQMPVARYISEQDSVQNLFIEKSFTFVVLSFLGFGLLLAFTPCVLPMIPILSGIIMGHRKKQLTTFKTFCLSLSYVLGMAVTYAAAGIVVALIGSRIQTELQRPWVIVIFSAIFILMALSLFGLYKIQLPVRWQQRLTRLSNRQKGGNYVSVFLMGSISSLIATPCISPPLVGVLAYIAQTGNVWLGAVALLALGIGMGIPLLLLGLSAGKLLPKAGPWMEMVERVMGLLMLAFAIWMLSRVIPGPFTLFLWSVLLICTAFFMGTFSSMAGEKQFLKRGLGAVVLVYGIILMIGAVLGNSNPLHPWENWAAHEKIDMKPAFTTLKNMEELNQILLDAKSQNKPVLIDFYADWCESCIRIERLVLTDPEVKETLSQFVLLRADITSNSDFDQALLKRFHVIAPPTFVFFSSEGQLQSEQIIGEVSIAKFLSHLNRVKDKET